MRRTNVKTGLGMFASATLFALGGCGRPVPPAETPAPTAPAPAAPAVEAPTGAVVPSSDAQPVSTAANQPASLAKQGSLPAITSMKLAQPPSKIGVPVDLHYQFDGEVKTGQPVTLHLAAVPRVAGSNLKVSIKNESGVSVTAGEITARKADAAAAYREQVSVTKLANGPGELRVLVTMELPEGSAFGWFGVPLNAASATEKQVKVPLQ